MNDDMTTTTPKPLVIGRHVYNRLLLPSKPSSRLSTRRQSKLCFSNEADNENQPVANLTSISQHNKSQAQKPATNHGRKNFSKSSDNKPIRKVPEITFVEFLKHREIVPPRDVIPVDFLSLICSFSKPLETTAQAVKWYYQLTSIYREGRADALKPSGYVAMKEISAVSKSHDCCIKFEYLEFLTTQLKALSADQVSALEHTLTREWCKLSQTLQFK